MEEALYELLAAWEEGRAAGTEPTPEALCPDDPARRDELRRRIARRRALAFDAPARPAPFPSPPPGYEILGELGRGGMGVVFKARQASVNRVVALKTTGAGVGDPAVLAARLRTEAEAAARLAHPNIVQVFDLGATPGGAFIAMEYVPGGTLEDRLRQPPGPPAEAARLVAVLARAVHFAHTRHVVHRDLKPSNVLFAADGTPKVADFGIAKLLDRAGKLTAVGQPIGSTDYMSPEQAAGRLATVGPATDVYALGVILYRLLVGRKPFQAGSAYDTLTQILFSPPPAPRGLRPDIPPPLEAACLKCLEKDPAHRFASAAALAEALETPAAAAPAGLFPARPSRTRPSRRAWLVAAVVVGLAGIGIAVYATRPGDSGPGPAADPPPVVGSTRISLAHRLNVPTAFGDPGVRDLAVHPDGRLVFAAGHGKNMNGVWSLTDGRFVRTLPVVGAVHFAAFAPDGRHLAVTHSEGGADLWRLPDWEPVGRRENTAFGLGFGPSGPVTAPAGPDHTVLWTAEEYVGTLTAWEVDGGEKRVTLPVGGQLAHLLAVSRDGRRLVTLDYWASEDPFPAAGVPGKTWDLTDVRRCRSGIPTAAFAVRRPPSCLALTPDGGRAFVGEGQTPPGGKDATVAAWDTENGTPVWTWKSEFETVGGLSVSPDGRWVAVGLVGNGGADDLVILSAATGAVGFQTRTGGDGGNGTNCLRFSADGKMVVTGAITGGLVVWDVRDE